MIEELDMHVLDLVQNAYSAQARTIEIAVLCDEAADQLTLRVADDGTGMNEQMLESVRHGYVSTKPRQSVGLGIPLLREVAQHCDGRFAVDSAPGEGTTVTATFRRSHIDLPPLGDLAATFLDILVTAEDRCVRITYRCDGDGFELDTEDLLDRLGNVPIHHPEVVRFLRDYLRERIPEKR